MERLFQKMDGPFSSIVSKQPTSQRRESLFTEATSASIDIPIGDYHHQQHQQRRTSRSGLRNSQSWARKRALMQRSYQWTTTVEPDHLNTIRDSSNDHRLLSNMSSLPNSLAQTDELVMMPSSLTAATSTTSFFEFSPALSDDVIERPRSARRLPAIPAESFAELNSEQADNDENDDLFNMMRIQNSPRTVRENSLGHRSSRSKSIDSDSSGKSRSVHIKLSQTHQTQNAKSVDISNLARRKSFLTVNENLIPQRSLDYPYIVRKTQDLSDIVRRRMLYSKISKQQQGDNGSISLEREHVPKVPRKIIIRQDNSIELSLR
jgi:hypothetical protein